MRFYAHIYYNFYGIGFIGFIKILYNQPNIVKILGVLFI